MSDADWSQNDDISRLLGERAALDPNGEAGRYPESNKGEWHFADLSTLNVRHFAGAAERLSDYLTVLHRCLADGDQCRMAYEAAMRDWHGY